MADMTTAIMREYANEKPRFVGFCGEVERILREVIGQSDVPVQSITSRVKEANSLEEKTRSACGRYGCLSDITDIAGVRIVTYFEEDVDRVASVIWKEFDVDWANSANKSDLLDADRFGYRSRHFVVQLADDRLRLSECSRYRGLKGEVQVRSVLQHAWAEIEHDLGYKTKNAVPSILRRRFARLAGLLELADTEFDHIRRELHAHQARLATIPTPDKRHVLIDLDSLRAFIGENEPIRELDAAAAGKARVMEPTARSIAHLLDGLAYFGVTTLAQVEQHVAKYRASVLSVCQALDVGGKEAVWEYGTCLRFLCYTMAAELGGEAGVLNYFTTLHGASDDDAYELDWRICLAKQIGAATRQARS